MSGKVAIVTGAGRGIGRAIALEFAREGAHVVVASRTTSTVEAVVTDIESFGGAAIGLTVDVGERDQIERMVGDAVEHFGGLDILVNNAQSFGTKANPTGALGHIALEDFPDDSWDYTFQTGLKATLWGMQTAFPTCATAAARSSTSARATASAR